MGLAAVDLRVGGKELRTEVGALSLHCSEKEDVECWDWGVLTDASVQEIKSLSSGWVLETQ